MGSILLSGISLAGSPADEKDDDSCGSVELWNKNLSPFFMFDIYIDPGLLYLGLNLNVPILTYFSTFNTLPTLYFIHSEIEMIAFFIYKLCVYFTKCFFLQCSSHLSPRISALHTNSLHLYLYNIVLGIFYNVLKQTNYELWK